MARLLTAIACMLLANGAVALEAMSSAEMGRVTGQDGIAFSWDLRINALEDGSPDPAVPEQERRLALSLANRPNEWLVFKNISGRIYFPTFNLDANVLPVSPSPYADTTRFVSGTGATVTPYGRPSLLLAFPEPIEFWNVEIGGMAVEYGTTGYFNDPNTTASFLSLGLNNSISGQPATLSIEGRTTIFGF